MNARGGILLAVIYHDSSPTPGRRRRKQLPRKGNNMNKRILGGLAAAVMLTGGLAISSGVAQATQADENGEHKVWVCHATSGLGELKNGYNLIEVDVASTQPGYDGPGNGNHYGHSVEQPYYQDNNFFGPLNDYIDVDPNNLPGKCGAPASDPPAECEFDEELAAGDEGCVPPCEFNEELAAGDEGCVPPVVRTPDPEVPAVQVFPPTAPTNRPPTQRPPDVVSAFSPAQAPPAEVSALPSVLPAQALPSTGIDGTGITAIIALLLTSLGGAALFLSRRRSTTI